METKTFFLRSIWKDKVAVALLLVPFIVLNGYFIGCKIVNSHLVALYGDSYMFSPLDDLNIALTVVYPIFCVMVLISFYIYHKLERDGITELNYLYSRNRTFFGFFLLMLTEILLLSVNAWIWTQSLYMQCAVYRSDYAWHILRNILCWYGLLMILAVFCGFGLARTKRGSIVGLIGIILVTSPIPAAVGRGLALNNDIDIFPIIRYLRIMPLPNYHSMTISTYLGYPVVKETVCLILFWSFLLIYRILSYLRIRKKWICYVVNTVVLLLCMGVIAYIPAESREEFEDVDKGGLHSQYYYGFSDKYESPEYKEADFSIAEYNLTFTVTDRLKGRAELVIGEESDSGIYNFTLYHTYKVKRVCDETGRELAYTRDSDYITVTGTEETEKIIVEYEGSAPGCYSHEAGMLLSSYFAFYPRPGINQVWNKTSDEYAPIQDDSKSLYHVTVDSQYTVYSNLNEVEENSFEGTSKGFFLVSGFVEVYEYRGVRYLYPYDGTNHNTELWDESIDLMLALEEESGLDSQQQGVRTILEVTDFNGCRHFTYGDNWAEMRVLSPDNMIQFDGYVEVPEEPQFIAHYKAYIGTNDNLCNDYFYRLEED